VTLDKLSRVFARLQPIRHPLILLPEPGQRGGAKNIMAAATIIHLGTDDRHRVTVLKAAGYLVNICDSFSQLHSALVAIPPADAVAVSESRNELCERAISLTRASSAVPLILFQSDISQLNEADFDLVVPTLTPPKVWIDEIKKLIEESGALRLRLEPLRQESAALQQKSALLRAESAAAREKSRRERGRSRMEVRRKPPK